MLKLNHLKKYFPINCKRALDLGIQIVNARDTGTSGAFCVPQGQRHKEVEIGKVTDLEVLNADPLSDTSNIKKRIM